MEKQQPQSRLGEIPTLWSQVRAAQTESGPAAAAALESLFQRYDDAVRRYLLAALGDEAAAADLSQEFALALVQGKLRRADPKIGRFRDYLKGILFRMVSQYRRRQKKQPSASSAALPERAVSDNDSDRQLQQRRRDELLARVWAGLAERQPDFFTVLHFRAAHPDLSAEELVAGLQPQLGRAATVDNLRQMLHRSRKLFADLLLADVTQSLKHPSLDAVRQELQDLDLLPYFQGLPASQHQQRP
jgi:RNA polymerase sigma factor (sigma-70 family)